MIDSLKRYIEKRFQLIKLELVSIFANMASGLVSSFLILVFSMFIVLMLSFSLAFWFAKIFDNYSIGFAIVGGIYTLLFILYLVFGKSKIDTKVKDAIVQSALKSDEKLSDEQ